MSDATFLPDHHPSSSATAVTDGNRSDSSGNEVETDSNGPLLQFSSQASTDDNAIESKPKVPGKQKRKRTRYALLIMTIYGPETTYFPSNGLSLPTAFF